MASQASRLPRGHAKPQVVTASTSSSAAVSENNPSAAVSLHLSPVCINNNNTLARWPLSKYANFIISQRQATVGTWQERTTGDPNDMWIQITQHRYIQIVHDEMLLECINLTDAQGTWRAIKRGANMLFFISNTKETSRKFRIRFLANNQEEPTSVADACACHLSRFLTLHDADRQGQIDDHREPTCCTISLQQLATAVLDPQNSQWPSDYADIGNSLELVPDLLRNCLMDPNFPSLVEAVERSMKTLMNSE